MGLEADLFEGRYDPTADVSARPYRCHTARHARGSTVVVHVWTDTGNLELGSLCSCGEREWLEEVDEDKDTIGATVEGAYHLE